MSLENTRSKKVTDNLLSLSVSNDISIASKEWRFSGQVIDNMNKEQTCELCFNEHLRYQYEIKNKENYNKLLVGSSCILKFSSIEIFDSNERPILETSLREKALKSSLDKHKRELSLKPLRKLYRAVSDDKEKMVIEEIAQCINERKGIDTDSLCEMISLFKRHKISFFIEQYRINLRTEFSQFRFKSLSVEQRKFLAPTLTNAQIKKHFQIVDDKNKGNR